MRVKAEAILDFGVADKQPNEIVREYRDEYKTLSELLLPVRNRGCVKAQIPSQCRDFQRLLAR